MISLELASKPKDLFCIALPTEIIEAQADPPGTSGLYPPHAAPSLSPDIGDEKDPEYLDENAPRERPAPLESSQPPFLSRLLSSSQFMFLSRPASPPVIHVTGQGVSEEISAKEEVAEVDLGVKVQTLNAAVVVQAATSGGTSHLLGVLRAAFSDIELIGGSFHLQEGDQANGLGLDFSAIGEFYATIVKLAPKDVIMPALINSITHLINQSSELLLKSEQSLLRTITVLFEFPDLDHPLYESLFKTICIRLAEISRGQVPVFVEWFSRYPTEQFVRILERLQVFFTSRFSSILPPDRTVKAIILCLELLGSFAFLPPIILSLLLRLILHNSKLAKENDCAPEPVVHFSRFYIDVLPRKLNFKAEYKKWLPPREQDR